MLAVCIGADLARRLLCDALDVQRREWSGPGGRLPACCSGSPGSRAVADSGGRQESAEEMAEHSRRPLDGTWVAGVGIEKRQGFRANPLTGGHDAALQEGRRALVGRVSGEKTDGLGGYPRPDGRPDRIEAVRDPCKEDTQAPPTLKPGGR